MGIKLRIKVKIKQYLTVFFGVIATNFGAIAILIPGANATPTEVGRIAKAVTVQINTTDSTGSGVLIQKTGNMYTVLTVAHVLSNAKAKDPTTITTQDGQKYAIASISATKDVDLAVVKFESKTNLPVAKFGDPTKSAEGSTVYVAGFPLATQVITSTIYNFTEGRVTANANRPLSLGYSLVYSNNTLPGMSGGPVFNDNGELIAVHGRGDFQENSKVSEINENVRIKTGFNLGITLVTVFKSSSSLGLTFPSSPNLVPSQPSKPIIAVAAAPKSDDFFLQGVDRFRRGDWAGAISMMDRAIQLNPKYLRAYTARGAANYMLNRIARGLEDMESALSVNPKYATGYVGKCYLLNELERWGQALGNCDRAIEIDPKLAIAYNVRGLVNIELKNYAPAQTDLERALELDPKSYYAYSNLALLYAYRNNPQAAFRYIRQALELNPQSAGCRVQLGQLLVLTGSYQEGISELNRAIAINPRISGAYEYRAAAYQALGNTNQAKIDAQIAQRTAQASPQGFIEDLSFLNQ